MEKISKFFRWLFEGGNYLGMVALILMMLITTSDVVGRIFNSPIKGSMELVVYAMVCVVGLGFGRCTIKEGHIRVDLFRVGPIVEKLNEVVMFLICGLMAYRAFMQGMNAIKMHTKSQLLGIPNYPFYFIFALGLALMTLGIFYNNFLKKYEPKEGEEEGANQ